MKQSKFNEEVEKIMKKTKVVKPVEEEAENAKFWKNTLASVYIFSATQITKFFQVEFSFAKHTTVNQMTIAIQLKSQKVISIPYK